jgi:hypothetical protein
MKSISFWGLVFAHPESHVFTQPALPSDFPSVVGHDALDPVELVRFDDELKGVPRGQDSET